MSNSYDLVLKHGKVIDVASGIDRVCDVGFQSGRVAVVAADIPTQEAATIFDATGSFVVPGLIDSHGHFAHKVSPYGADPDLTCLRTGVTTAVDAGSLGWTSFPAFRSFVIERVETRLLSFLYLGSLGTVPVATGIPDLEDRRLVQIDETIRCIEQNRGVVLGVKVRLCPTGAPLETAVDTLRIARDVADHTRTRVMVHVMDCPISLERVFQHLRPGDVVSHIFHGTEHGVVDGSGRIRSAVWDAHRSGILFDTACFMQHFSIPICRLAVDTGLYPHLLSTDWVGPWMRVRNYTLLEVMSLFLGLGMPLNSVVARVTQGPARMVNRADLGTFAQSAVADATVFRLSNEEVSFNDMLGNTLGLNQLLRLVAVVKSGELVIHDP